jgi:hypothetical protein
MKKGLSFTRFYKNAKLSEFYDKFQYVAKNVEGFFTKKLSYLAYTQPYLLLIFSRMMITFDTSQNWQKKALLIRDLFFSKILNWKNSSVF